MYGVEALLSDGGIMRGQGNVGQRDLFNQLSCYPHGVGHGDEGVCLELRLGPRRILLDCGLPDAAIATLAAIPFDAVFCSHAHPDHARGLLALHRARPQLPIYASAETVHLLPLNWPTESVPPFCQLLAWQSPLRVTPELTVTLFPAGHLPGAAAIALTYHTPRRTYKVLHTGDFFLSNSRLVEGLSLESLRQFAPDISIVEGTYGTARHPHRRRQENQLMAQISHWLDRQLSVLLPVPVLGLAQEILVLLRSHHQFTGRDLDIWVEADLAVACDAYLDLLPTLPAAVQNFARHQPLFWDERVRPRLHRLPAAPPAGSADDTTPSPLDDPRRTPCVLLADRVGDWQRYCRAQPGRWVALLPERGDRPQVDPDLASTTAIDTFLLAQHSDGLGTTQLIHNLRPQHVLFVHGLPEYLADLTALEELQNRYQLHLPSTGQVVELPMGETFLQPAAPPERYHGGEVHDDGTQILLVLADTLRADPRWHNFADTGVIEARWQGEELVLRGMSAQEVFNLARAERVPIDADCCGNCRFYQQQSCRNPSSPLHSLQVTPDGYCPMFVRQEP